MWTHLVFLLFVALAVYAQSLTGFALALILLGLIGATDLVPLTDAVNAVTVMVFVNACTFLYQRFPPHFERWLWPGVISSLLGAAVGTLLLTWLAGTFYQVVKLLLGISIIASAFLLWRAAKPLETASSRPAFVLTGAISGLLGGMFSAPGPPLVYLMYRQPWTPEKIQESLIFFFGAGALLRLLIVVATDGFSLQATQLAAEAVPVVFLVTAFAAGRSSPLSPPLLKLLVCLLLVATGGGTVGGALSAMR